MKLYLEMNETLTEEQMLTVQPQALRVEVTSKEEAVSKASLYASLFSGRSYVAQLHTCRHEDGGACTVEVL
jgi:hypothetical protein